MRYNKKKCIDNERQRKSKKNRIADKGLRDKEFTEGKKRERKNQKEMMKESER